MRCSATERGRAQRRDGGQARKAGPRRDWALGGGGREGATRSLQGFSLAPSVRSLSLPSVNKSRASSSAEQYPVRRLVLCPHKQPPVHRLSLSSLRIRVTLGTHRELFRNNSLFFWLGEAYKISPFETHRCQTPLSRPSRRGRHWFDSSRSASRLRPWAACGGATIPGKSSFARPRLVRSEVRSCACRVLCQKFSRLIWDSRSEGTASTTSSVSSAPSTITLSDTSSMRHYSNSSMPALRRHGKSPVTTFEPLYLRKLRQDDERRLRRKSSDDETTAGRRSLTKSVEMQKAQRIAEE